MPQHMPLKAARLCKSFFTYNIFIRRFLSMGQNMSLCFTSCFKIMTTSNIFEITFFGHLNFLFFWFLFTYLALGNTQQFQITCLFFWSNWLFCHSWTKNKIIMIIMLNVVWSLLEKIFIYTYHYTISVFNFLI